ncbi:type II secretion system protein GspJ [Chromobacterium sp. IIBBL 290-4]|uniref:type II secretion system protein GspJ n=1 Tax=Chromobacterium sp. IIBBL 290-4 TaxID=2953890 RepID=UPI0020B6520C|nr:type II secretion system protein GspJ [Chromobacterium sp. IIBBL 290-4]UTH72282.1 prepilin-type N-terminal cleavage/methylation domain-containing protein [Chromobacterium sp. IIBBL 290-4]
MSAKTQRGMTLLEILVAMSLLAILSVMGYKAFGSLLIARERLMQTGEQWVDAARAFRRLESDLSGQQPSPTNGDQMLGAMLGASSLTLLEEGKGQSLVLESVSARYPGGMERISYQAGEKGLSWSAGSGGSGSEAPIAYTLLGAGMQVSWRVLLNDGSWQNVWPMGDGAQGRVARALEMRVKMPGGKQVHRVWVLP